MLIIHVDKQAHHNFVILSEIDVFISKWHTSDKQFLLYNIDISSDDFILCLKLYEMKFLSL